MTRTQILVVEDDTIVAENIRRKLNSAGYGVPAIVMSGEEAIEKAGEICPALVLMDIGLAGDIEGVEAAQQIRTRFDIPVVYLTAHADEATLQHAKITEPFGYMIKPFELSELRSIIEIALYKHQLEQQLKGREAHFRLLYEEAPLAYQSLDEEGCFLDVNPAWLNLLSYQREEVIGRWFGDFLAPDYVEHFRKNFFRFKAAGEIYGIEFEMMRKDGSRFIVSFNGRIGHDEQGHFKQTHCILHDITARKQTEEALQAERDTLNTIMETTHAQLAYLDPQFNFVRVNSAYVQGSGHRREELLGRNHFDLFPNAENQAIFEQVRATGQPVAFYAKPFEYADQPERGVTYWDWTLAPVKDSAGRVQGLVLSLLDVSAHKQTEEALRQTETWLRTILTNMPITIYTMDSQGIFTLSEGKGLERVGLKPGENVGVSAFELYSTLPYIEHTGTVIYGQDIIHRALAGETISAQNELNSVHFENHIGPLRDAAGDVVGVVGVAVDITERKAMERELQVSEQRFRQLFARAPISIWEEDFSAVGDWLAELRARGVHDLGAFLQAEPQALEQALALVRLVDINDTTLQLFEANSKEELLNLWTSLFTDDTLDVFAEELRVIWEGRNQVDFECSAQTVRGRPIHYLLHWVAPLEDGRMNLRRVIVAIADITERKQAEKALQQYTERLQILHEVDQAILATRSLEEISQAILGRIQELVPCVRVSIVLFDLKTGQATVFARLVKDCPQVGVGAFVPLEALGDINKLRRGEIYFLNDFQALSHLPTTVKALQADGVQAYANVPLIAQGELIGTLNLGLDTPDALTAAHLDIAREVADSLAIAIRQSRLFEAERAARQIADALYEANQALTQTLELDTILETSLTHLQRLVPYDSASVMLLDSDDLLAIRAVRGYERWTDPDVIRQLTFDPQTHSFLFATLKTRQSFLIPDTYGYPGWKRVLAGIDSGDQYIRNWLGVPLVAGGQVIGLYSVDKDTPDFFTEEHVRLAEALAAQSAVAIKNAQLFEQVQTAHHRLQALSRRLVLVQEDERRHLARELHDEVGQSLTGLKLLLEVIARLPADSAPFKLAEALRLVEELLTQVHNMSLDLRPAMLDDLGLLPALLWLIERYTDRTGVQVHFEQRRLEQRFRPELEIAAYRLVQEALTNIARHAKVNEATVWLRADESTLHILVQDAGIGFDLPAVLAGSRTAGLTNMQERATLLGGWLEIDTQPGRGARVSAALPLKEKEETG